MYCIVAVQRMKGTDYQLVLSIFLSSFLDPNDSHNKQIQTWDCKESYIFWVSKIATNVYCVTALKEGWQAE